MTAPTPTIRPAVQEDLDALVGLLRVLFSIEEDFQFDGELQRLGLLHLLANRQGRLLVAEQNGQVIGMCSGQIIISTAEGGPALLVEDVVVADRWRNRGIGRQLLAGLSSWAGQQGITRLQLLADKDNHAALAFYDRLHWQTTQLICLRKYINMRNP